MSIGLTYALSSRDVILAQMFEGGPLLRGGALAILEKVITLVLLLVFTGATLHGFAQFLEKLVVSSFLPYGLGEAGYPT